MNRSIEKFLRRYIIYVTISLLLFLLLDYSISWERMCCVCVLVINKNRFHRTIIFSLCLYIESHALTTVMIIPDFSSTSHVITRSVEYLLFLCMCVCGLLLLVFPLFYILFGSIPIITCKLSSFIILYIYKDIF
jgi:hypothetical protein